ncbi:hypothetical protein AVEN_132299-1 [Araneus ventricosus]|uniref:Uncharacterized protein n=1 Tax=Araneus ventricosus TaxID=182803 RepID=A0A4Y2TCN4_ARAVE|nr:hypothetical protein AVEN_132299-1 [Araneus ventricosus]
MWSSEENQGGDAKMLFSNKWTELFYLIPHSGSSQPTALQGNSFEEHKCKGVLKKCGQSSDVEFQEENQGGRCEDVILYQVDRTVFIYLIPAASANLCFTRKFI